MSATCLPVARHRHHFHHLHHCFLLLTLALSACRPATSPGLHAASLDTEVVLAIAQRAAFDQEGLEVQFVSVVDDSRCPIDTTCVWAGEAIVRLAIRSASGTVTEHDVVEGHSTTVDNYRVSVTQVLPKPVSTRKIAPADYRVTIKVQRS